MEPVIMTHQGFDIMARERDLARQRAMRATELALQERAPRLSMAEPPLIINILPAHAPPIRSRHGANRVIWLFIIGFMLAWSALAAMTYLVSKPSSAGGQNSAAVPLTPGATQDQPTTAAAAPTPVTPVPLRSSSGAPALRSAANKAPDVLPNQVLKAPPRRALASPQRDAPATLQTTRASPRNSTPNPDQPLAQSERGGVFVDLK